MAIDIMFLIMTGFGFYFGWIYGPVKVVVLLLSIVGAVAAAMRFTPLTVQLIQETFEVSSPFLPFLAFAMTLIVVLLAIRMFTRLFEESIDNQKFNRLSQFLGGIMISLVFTFLFSVLIKFFSAADVIKPERAERTSFFYKYIDKIPEYGAVVLGRVMPFVQSFSAYMRLSLEQLENRQRKPKRSRVLESENVSPDSPEVQGEEEGGEQDNPPAQEENPQNPPSDSAQ